MKYLVGYEACALRLVAGLASSSYRYRWTPSHHVLLCLLRVEASA
jgi:hypothetical protein